MKQRVVVQVIFKQDDRVFLLKRSQGRPGLIGKYELPGGTINSGEQPDDALRRHIENSTGILIDQEGLVLSDVLSVNSRDEGDIQHIFIVYVYNKSIDLQFLKLGISYDDHVELDVKLKANSLNIRDSAKWILGIDGDINNRTYNSSNDVKKATNDFKTLIYSDGGSRGNPGPSAAAFVIMNNHHDTVDKGGEFMGFASSNQAEYYGVLLGLEKAKSLGIRDIEFRIDSMLVVNQLKGLYKIKNKELIPMNHRIVSLLGNFSNVTFKHVPREMNRAADALVNKILDENK